MNKLELAENLPLALRKFNNAQAHNALAFVRLESAIRDQYETALDLPDDWGAKQFRPLPLSMANLKRHGVIVKASSSRKRRAWIALTNADDAN
jgi:hypothetical protein